VLKKEIESFLRGSCKRRKDKKRASEGGVAKKSWRKKKLEKKITVGFEEKLPFLFSSFVER